jgi:hypothetical protein
MKKIALILTIAIFGVLGVSARGPKPIGMTRAKAIALQQVKGKIVHSKTIKDKGQPTYLIEIKNQSGELTKLKIDAAGSVLDTSTVAANQTAKTKRKKHWWIF